MRKPPYTTAQVSRNNTRYVYVLSKNGDILHMEQAYDCGHGGSIISERLKAAGYPYSMASSAAWAQSIRRTFQADMEYAGQNLDRVVNSFAVNP